MNWSTGKTAFRGKYVLQENKRFRLEKEKC